jgi:CHRD domain
MKKLRVSGFLLALTFALASAASAQEVKMAATLSGGEETPGVLTGAVGTAEIDVDATRRTVVVRLNLFNLPTGTTAGHIHVGSRGIAGPVVLDFAFPAGLTGDQTLTFSLTQRDLRVRADIGILTMADAIQAIVGGNAYVNIHTSTFPGGEVRGQIVPR